MIVVADTSPISYLVLIEAHDILPALFGDILIPLAVSDELRSLAAPEPISRFMAEPPPWLSTRPAGPLDPALANLGAGERDAITLALSIHADMLLLDERKGRQAARDRGMAVAGTLGVLDLAAKRGLIDITTALGRLRRTTFRASARLLAELEQAHRRRPT